MHFSVVKFYQLCYAKINVSYLNTEEKGGGGGL